ncbi:MAG: DUF222 domain-containing protein [Candidatus Nanopelagicales bacterium]
MAAETSCFVDVEAGEAMPPGWSPYPSPAEVAEFEALMVSLGYRDREHDDAPPHPDELDEHPAVSEVLGDPVQALGLLSGPGTAAGSFDVGVLESLDLAAVTAPQDLLVALKALDKVEAWVHARRVEVLTALAGTEPSGAYLAEVHLEHEVAVARRTSDYAAGVAIDVARTVTTTFPDFLAALRCGAVAWGHLAVLVDRTRFVADPDALAQIAARALARARTRTPGQFAGEVEKLVARFDPDAAERHRKARKKDRKVWVKRLADGMGMLGYVDEWSLVNAVYETIAADGRALKKTRKQAAAAAAARGAGDATGHDGDAAEDPADEHDPSDEQDPSDGEGLAGGGRPADPAGDDGEPGADADRATALAARVLGSVGPDGSVTWDRASATLVRLNVTIDYLTLTRERERIALLDGQPVPAEIGREYAAMARTFRRFVTDPVDDHLLDLGTTDYTHAHLRAFTLARDICRNPVHQHASTSTRLEMDHAEEHPRGPTSAGNCGGVCIPSHQLKTARLVDITDSKADGSCTWTTAWGQVVHIPPRASLDTPDPPDPPQHETEPAPQPGPGPDQHDPPPF